jgi:hypothetical protein
VAHAPYRALPLWQTLFVLLFMPLSSSFSFQILTLQEVHTIHEISLSAQDLHHWSLALYLCEASNLFVKEVVLLPLPLKILAPFLLQLLFQLGDLKSAVLN